MPNHVLSPSVASFPDNQNRELSTPVGKGGRLTFAPVLALWVLVGALSLVSRPTFAAPLALRVNFYPYPGTSVSAGHVNDTGSSYAVRSGGYTYGWVGTTPTMAARNNSLTTDPRGASDPAIPSGKAQPSQKYLTHAAFTAGAWEAQVPNGQYSVRVVAGDAAVFGAYSLSVEGRATV